MVKHSGALAIRRNGPRPLGTAREIAARTGWQPIETAPRDGTPVLLLNKDGDGCFIGLFYADYGDWGDEDMLFVWPTFWHPLPALPETP